MLDRLDLVNARLLFSTKALVTKELEAPVSTRVFILRLSTSIPTTGVIVLLQADRVPNPSKFCRLISFPTFLVVVVVVLL